MTAAKHTPGPWHTSDVGRDLVIYDESGWAVADAKVFHSRHTMDEALANARLIAAAPELLEALKELLSEADDGIATSPLTRINARAVIIKATGGAA